ncbi:tetratricopeptide repeat protein [Psychrobacillus sp. OK028]|uniref:tetratricopeptide repeat protein n=1 Tax=Psychrobacillus sp. OK028 TaxID=1884359 RepID=UPI001113A867
MEIRKQKHIFKQLTSKNANHDKVGVQYAESLIEEGDRELAIEVLEKIISRNTTYNHAHKLLEKLKES